MNKTRGTKMREQFKRIIALANIKTGYEQSGLTVAEFAREKGIELSTLKRAMKGVEPSREGTKSDFANAYNVNTYEDLREINKHNLSILAKYICKDINVIFTLVLLIQCQ